MDLEFAAIMEAENRTWSDTGYQALDHFLRRKLPVEANCRPHDAQQSVPPLRFPQSEPSYPIRRTEKAGRLAVDRGQSGLTAIQFRVNSGKKRETVGIGMIADLVPPGRNLAGDGGQAVGLHTDLEKSRLGAEPVEKVEQAGRRFARAVVEGQSDRPARGR